jgi:YD repeat-containing protein
MPRLQKDRIPTGGSTTASRLIESYDANGNKTTYTYDAANQLLSQSLIMEDGRQITTSYRYGIVVANGTAIDTIDPNGVTQRAVYNNRGQLIEQIKDPGGLNIVTAYSYDEQGHVLTVTQSGTGSATPTVRRYQYDGLGRRTDEYLDGIGRTVHYEYDLNNNLISSTDALGNISRFGYDSENREIR